MISLTALVLTHNEKENIGRTLTALSWVPSIVLIDSGSTDGTQEIALTAYPSVRIISRPFDSFAGQCNFGLSQISSEWVLSLDADYIVTPELGREVVVLDPPADVAGYSAKFRYCIHGRPLRNTVYPARTVLYRRALAQYLDEGHGHRVVVRGKIEPFAGKIDHDDRKPLQYWIEAQDRYARVEARHLLSQPFSGLNFQDRLRRRILFAAPAIFLYLLFGKGLILDGWPGWFYVAQRTFAELLLSMRLLFSRENLEERNAAS